MKKIGKHVLIASLLLLLTVGTFFIGRRSGVRRASVYDLRKLTSTLRLIDKYYVDSVEIDSLVQEVVPKLVRELDPHSSYFTAKEQEEERQGMQGKFFGIGITFNTVLDTAVVISVIPRGPSDLVGIRAGDRIIKVDGVPISGKDFSADSVRSLLKGPDKSKVNLSIYRPSTHTNLAIQVIRGEIAVRQIQAAYMVNDTLGCIVIPKFSMGLHEAFMRGYADLVSRGAKGLVVDLRDNPGGLLHAAIAVSNEFLHQGQMIIYTQGRSEPKMVFKSDGTGTLQHIPVYVLLNESSASSSEIVSGALQDNDRAILIGRRTFGKGLVQKLFDFPDGSSVHLTIARYYTPSGRSIQREYKLGGDASYVSDWYNRQVNGEMYHFDSIHTESAPAFKTLQGRTVYGGGGIIPDIFIPRDTTGYTTYLAEVMTKGLVQKYAFVYADKHRELLLRLGNGDACYKFLSGQGIVWQFAQWATTRGVRMKNYLVYLSHDILFRHLSMLVVQQIFGDDDAARVASFTDPMVQKAAALFSEGIEFPKDLPSSATADAVNATVERQGDTPRQ